MADKNTDLVARAKQGDSKALEELYSEYKDKLTKFLIKRGLSEQDAEDIVSETFVEVMKHIQDLDNNEFFGTWIHRIALNKALDFKKKYNAHQRVIFESDEETGLGGDEAAVELAFEAEYGDTVLLPSDYAENEDTKRLLAEQLNSLNDDYKEVLVLFYYENRSINEIAEMTGITPNNAKVRLFNARKSLKKKLEELQKKGVVLSVVPLFALVSYFRSGVLGAAAITAAAGAASGAAATVGASASGAVATGAGAAAGTAAAGAGAASGAASAAGAAGLTIGTKIAAAVIAVAVAAGAGAAAVIANRDDDDDDESIVMEEEVRRYYGVYDYYYYADFPSNSNTSQSYDIKIGNAEEEGRLNTYGDDNTYVVIPFDDEKYGKSWYVTVTNKETYTERFHTTDEVSGKLLNSAAELETYPKTENNTAFSDSLYQIPDSAAPDSYYFDEKPAIAIDPDWEKREIWYLAMREDWEEFDAEKQKTYYETEFVVPWYDVNYPIEIKDSCNYSFIPFDNGKMLSFSLPKSADDAEDSQWYMTFPNDEGYLRIAKHSNTDPADCWFSAIDVGGRKFDVTRDTVKSVKKNKGYSVTVLGTADGNSFEETVKLDPDTLLPANN